MKDKSKDLDERFGDFQKKLVGLNNIDEKLSWKSTS